MSSSFNPLPPVRLVGLLAHLDASLSDLIESAPEANGLAFLFFPGYGDWKKWAAGLAKDTCWPFLLIEDGMPVEAGRVYVVPDAQSVTVQGASFQLSPNSGISGGQGVADTLLSMYGKAAQLVLMPKVKQLGLTEGGSQLINAGGRVISVELEGDFERADLHGVCAVTEVSDVWGEVLENSTESTESTEANSLDYRRGLDAWMRLIQVNGADTNEDVIGSSSPQWHFNQGSVGTYGRQTSLNLLLQQQLMRGTDRIARMGAWEYDTEDATLFWSPELRELHEVEADYAPSWPEVVEFIKDSDRETISEAMEATIRDGGAFDQEVRLAARSGRELVVRVVARTYEGERGRKIVGVYQDVTEAAQMELGQRVFFDLSPELLGSVTFGGALVNVSPSWRDQLGWEESALADMSLLDIVAEADRALLENILKRVKASGAVEQEEMRLRTEAGQERWFACSVFGDVSLGIAFFSARDINERKQAEADMLDARLRAEEADRAKSNFLAVMSHEMRTPLNPILGLSSLLLEEVTDEEHLNCLKLIKNAGEDLIATIDNVLEFSKIEAGHVELNEQKFQLQKLLVDELKLARVLADKKGLQLCQAISIQSVDDSERDLYGDASKIRRILRNLLSNAIKFTHEGTVTLSAFIDTVVPTTPVVHIKISDTGIGVTAEDAKKLFNPFSQVDSSMSRSFGGSGLGLSICKQLVELMHGSISMKSEPGQGSSFEYKLPLRWARTEASALVDAGVAKKMAWAPFDCLLAEDNRMNVLFLTKLIEGIGGKVTVACNGLEACEHYSQKRFDMIFLDLHMPEMNGIEVLRFIRSREAAESVQKPIAICVLTADAVDTVRDECLDSGANDFLSKPVSVAELRRIVGCYLAAANLN